MKKVTRSRRRLLRSVALVLIALGSLIALDVLMTVVWQEPVTAIIATIQQQNIDRSLEKPAKLSEPQQWVVNHLPTAAQRVLYFANLDALQVKDGQAIGKISIPKIDVKFDIIQGTSTADLIKGPGHYPETRFPGQGSTIAIAGHRTTYLAPFRNINSLDTGDKITITMPYGVFTYTVQYQRVVSPTDWSIINPQGYERLVLSACTPLFSASHRLIVFAKLTHITPTLP